MTVTSDPAAGSCCGGPKTSLPLSDPQAIREQVREGYARIATQGSFSAAGAGADTEACCAPADSASGNCCEPSAVTTAPSASTSSCCAPAPNQTAQAQAASGGGGCCGLTTFTPEQLAAAIGYSQSDLASTPEGANLGLSCGNPTALASLRDGEIVLDLGSGGGFDCFVAGPKVGAKGRIIGVDMTPEMISRARGNVAGYREHSGLDNVEFRLGEIEHLPVPDASVDVVISNCVLNLSPDKPQVWREIARVLKPGGRAAISDLALLRPIPEAVARDVEALVGCIAGASLVSDVKRMAEEAGLKDLVLTSKPQYIAAMMNSEDPLYRRILDALPKGMVPSDFVTSLDISARR